MNNISYIIYKEKGLTYNYIKKKLEKKIPFPLCSLIIQTENAINESLLINLHLTSLRHETIKVNTTLIN